MSTARIGHRGEKTAIAAPYPPENCAAFGDYLNDIEMLQAVKYSYAMENAHPALFEAANDRAEANTAHGVTKKLRELLDAGKI